MTIAATGFDPSHIAVIIPALNEADNLAELLPILSSLNLAQIIVCDNGSTDATPQVVRENNALWIHEPVRGYGSACYAGIDALTDSITIVVFIDADLSDDPRRLPELVTPIAQDESDFVLGARVASLREAGSTSAPQRIGNWLVPKLIRCCWNYQYLDMGPFRAIRRDALDAIDMQDRAFGWTIEMQVRAVELGLRIREIPVPHRRRLKGDSKISGTVRGVFLATYWILRTCFMLWITKRRRCSSKAAH